MFSGRKRICILYGILYILSCVTKHFPDFKILLLGRIIGGICTSILFSTFESWMINEHNNRGFGDDLLDSTFYYQNFGNGVIAILAGLIGNLVSGIFSSFVAPFDASIVFLTMGLYFIFTYWSENYGDNSNGLLFSNFSEAYYEVLKDIKILCLGVSQSLFEGCMYTFVFMWTPVLEKYWDNLPHGIIFSSFMVCCMIGSGIYKTASKFIRVEKLILIVYIISSACLAIPLFFENGYLILFGFCLHEICIGVFWPGMGKMKSSYIPERVRSTMMNYFRIPTNLFVVLVLARVKDMHMNVVFGISVTLMLIAVISQFKLVSLTEKNEIIAQIN